MKVKALEDVHIREEFPNRNSMPKGIIFQGFVVDVAKIVSGEDIDGNHTWYQDFNGDFIWSGGTTRVEEVPVEEVVQEADERDKLSVGHKKLGIAEIWQHNRGEGVRVAVIDTGIDKDHQEFTGAIVEGFNARGSNPSFDDIDGHGTHCAGIIGARGIGETIGIAPACKLYPIKMIHRQTSGFIIEAFERAIDWAISKNVHVISLSLGKDEDPGNIILELIEKAAAADIVVVAAVGNDGSDLQSDGLSGDFPAVHPECISVGALTDELILTSYTSRFDGITLCAPGDNVHSTWLNGAYRKETCTSMATPFVAGVVALLRSKRPDLKAEAIRQALEDTVVEKDNGSFRYRVIQPLAAFNSI